MKTLRMAVVPFQIGTGHLPSASQLRYRYTNVLGNTGNTESK
jgi:hypothetical protein